MVTLNTGSRHARNGCIFLPFLACGSTLTGALNPIKAQISQPAWKSFQQDHSENILMLIHISLSIDNQLPQWLSSDQEGHLGRTLIVTPITIIGIAKTTATVTDLSSLTGKGIFLLWGATKWFVPTSAQHTDRATAFRELPWDREGNSYKLLLAEGNLSPTKWQMRQWFFILARTSRLQQLTSYKSGIWLFILSRRWCPGPAPP